jgi:hypothetical protein
MPATSHINMLRHIKGDDAARREVLRAISKTRGHKLKAAKELGIGKTAFYRLIEELGLADQIDKLCEERGFQVGAGRDRGQVDEDTAEAIREGRQKQLGQTG